MFIISSVHYSLYFVLLFLDSNTYFQQMDISINGETSRSSFISSHSFNKTINHLFSTVTHPKPSVLAQLTSCKLKNMVRHSCHIMFLLQCMDHDFIPKGLIIKDPVGSSESSKTLHNASMTLVKQQLKQCRTSFAKEKKAFDSTMATLKQLLDTSYFTKLSEFLMTSSRAYHNKHLRKHQKKFNNLILRYHAPFVNSYDNLASFDISHLTFSGLFKHSAPVVKPSSNVITNAVVNLADHPLEEEETKLLSLGLKFSPSIKKSTVAETSAGLEPI